MLSRTWDSIEDIHIYWAVFRHFCPWRTASSKVGSFSQLPATFIQQGSSFCANLARVCLTWVNSDSNVATLASSCCGDCSSYWGVMGIYAEIAYAAIDLHSNKSIVPIEQPAVCAHRQVITATVFLNRSKEHHPNLNRNRVQNIITISISKIYRLARWRSRAER